VSIIQFKVGSDNISYIIYSLKTLKAAIVDPGYNVSNLIEFLLTNHLTLEYIILTHYHRDHTAGTKKIKNSNSESKIIASELDGKKLDTKVDIKIKDNDELEVGVVKLKFILTPGHTAGGICIIVDNEALITGDTLFIGDCGRTDLPGGSLTQMFKTLQEKILPLPDHLIVYPGHDYGDKPYDNLGNLKPSLNELCITIKKQIDDIRRNKLL
jgi:glyoxylase-like metal-dependent hydrolase (beta-lactamase superfamily II)